jgi:exosortase sorting signal-containing protein
MTYSIISRTLLLFAALFLVTSTLVSAQDSFTDIDPGNIPEAGASPDNTIVDFVIVGDLEFFDNEGSFNNTCTGLAFEDFEDTNLPPNSVLACTNPLNSSTNDACYSPGALIPGFSLGATAGDTAVVTPPSLGVTNVAAGPNTFADDTVITFTEPVNGVGMVLVGPLGNTAVDVQVFGEGNVFLGSAIVNLVGVNGTFVGVIAGGGEQITRIELVGGNAELLYDLSFGDCGCDVTIVKSALPADDTLFDFSVDGNGGDFTLSDPSDTAEEINIGEGDTLTIIEQLPLGWQLDDVVCDVTIGGIIPTVIDGGVSLECSSSSGVAGCTFFNSLAPRPIPTQSEWGLLAMAGVLGIIGLLAIRRRKLTA